LRSADNNHLLTWGGPSRLQQQDGRIVAFNKKEDFQRGRGQKDDTV
jgi:hypothetical protein